MDISLFGNDWWDESVKRRGWLDSRYLARKTTQGWSTL